MGELTVKYHTRLFIKSKSFCPSFIPFYQYQLIRFGWKSKRNPCILCNLIVHQLLGGQIILLGLFWGVTTPMTPPGSAPDTNHISKKCIHWGGPESPGGEVLAVSSNECRSAQWFLKVLRVVSSSYSCPSSSAGVERLFITYSITDTKLRYRLSHPRFANLVTVRRPLASRSP